MKKKPRPCVDGPTLRHYMHSTKLETVCGLGPSPMLLSKASKEKRPMCGFCKENF